MPEPHVVVVSGEGEYQWTLLVPVSDFKKNVKLYESRGWVYAVESTQFGADHWGQYTLFAAKGHGPGMFRDIIPVVGCFQLYSYGYKISRTSNPVTWEDVMMEVSPPGSA
ncbi:MAG: hypothetical protein ACYCOU_10280 [Sulfobacillus sp.]